MRQKKRKAEAEGTFIDTSVACFPMLILQTVSSKGCRDRGQAKGRAASKGKAFINPVHQCSGCGYCCDSSCIRFSCTIRPQCRNRYEPCIITNSPVLYTARGCRVESKITTRISRCESKSISIIYKSAPSHGRIGKVHGYETRQSAGRVSPEELGP